LNELLFLISYLSTVNSTGISFIEACYKLFRLDTNYDAIKKVLLLPDEDRSSEKKDTPWLNKALLYGTDISFENVSFRYAADKKDVLSNVSFKIDKNKSCAIIGNSGSGKTTIGKLLLRLYKPTSGVIKINGRDLNTLTSDELYQLVVSLSQEVHLFENDTVKFNIAYGFSASTETDELLTEIRKEEETAHLELIEEKKSNVEGYAAVSQEDSLVDSYSEVSVFDDESESVASDRIDTRVDVDDDETKDNDNSEFKDSVPQNGNSHFHNSSSAISHLLRVSLLKSFKSVNIRNKFEIAVNSARVEEFIDDISEPPKLKKASDLSIGQKQRVGLARLLTRNSSIFVFDEPTAALDSEIEADVIKAIKDNTKKKTSLMISHRLNTVAYADKIIVIENGKVTQNGTHDSLLLEEGKYKTLWNLQMKIS
jgi:ABC-type multidrug transport system fused ATPase/permease subunit